MKLVNCITYSNYSFYPVRLRDSTIKGSSLFKTIERVQTLSSPQYKYSDEHTVIQQNLGPLFKLIILLLSF